MRQSLRINQYIFQSTLSMRRATYHDTDQSVSKIISIHALHEESDRPCQRQVYARGNFNPRSP